MTAELKEEKRFIEAGQIKFWQRVFNLMKNKFLRLCDSKFENSAIPLRLSTNSIGYNDKGSIGDQKFQHLLIFTLVYSVHAISKHLSVELCFVDDQARACSGCPVV